MTVRDDILAVADHSWRNARDLHKRIGMWSLPSVAGTSIKMVNDAVLEKRAVSIPQGVNGFEWQFRLAIAQQENAA